MESLILALWSCQLQRILVSNTSFGSSVDVVEFIVGFVMLKLEGETITEQLLAQLLTLAWYMNHFLLYEMKLSVMICCRLTNEQRSAVAEYFRVYKVVFSRAKLCFILLVSGILSNSLSLIIVYVTQGNENNAKKVDLMGHSLHPFLAYGFLHHLCVFLISMSLSLLLISSRAFQEIICGFS